MTSVASTAFQRIIAALRDHGSTVNETGSTVMAQCPAHPDNNPSLSIGSRQDGRGAVIHCHAGCNYADVTATLGLTDSDLFDDPLIKDALYPVKDYIYKNGRINHRAVKPNGDKTFWQEGSGDKSLYAVDRIGDNKVVYFCEGEKGADLLWALGYAAVATGGSQRSCDLEPLQGRVVLIIADRDEAGHEWAHRQHRELKPLTAGLCILQAKVDIAKADIVEHIAAGFSIDELEPIAAAETNGHAAGRQLVWTTGDKIQTAVPVWAWHYQGKGRIQLGTLSLLAGRPGAGKSSAARWFATQASLGQLEGHWDRKPQHVAYIAAEESLKYTIAPGLRAAGADMGRIHFPSAYHDSEPVQILSTLDELRLTQYMVANNITIVIVDPLMSTVTTSTDIYKNNEVRSQIAPWSRMADTINGIILGVVHLRKGSSNGDVVAAINGSSAFGELARSIFAFAKATDSDERVMSQHKNSTGSEDLALLYEIRGKQLQVDDGEIADVGTFCILSDSEYTVEDIMADGMQTSGVGVECKRWLEDYLSVEGPAKSSDVKKAAMKVGNWGHSAVERAAKKLRVLSTSEGFPRMTIWTLPSFQSPHSDPH